VKRDPDIEDLRLWAVVTSTVRPLQPASPRLLLGKEDREAVTVGQSAPPPKPAKKPKPAARHPHSADASHRPALAVKGRDAPPTAVEAALHRRLVRGRDDLAARIDLHGLTHDAARAALTRFILNAVDDGWRAVLVITGKGVGGDGVLRRRAPDWLAEAPLREHIAGVSEAHRRHGGEGALYVALKRRR
jgi:DNA-nicking Smr family endonuclease